MHMADALVSPAVGGTMWAVSGGLVAFCASRLRRAARDDLVPVMGVLGAFVFTAQMVNFPIPWTGSSGHLCGGLILAVLLGPRAAFLVMASVLTVQALFFLDGGLLALGCNALNLGFFPAFVAYPLVYRVMAWNRHGAIRGGVATVAAAVVGIQLGALGVVLQTWASGISEVPFRTFMLLMLPVHLAIGVVEGLATAAVISFVARARPEALTAAPVGSAGPGWRPVLTKLAAAAAVVGGVASWFASARPDGLEWAVAKSAGGQAAASAASGLHKALARVQERTAFLPEYGFRPAGRGAADAEAEAPTPEPWPAVSAETSVSGLVGGTMTLALACLVGVLLRSRSVRCGHGHGHE